jgi:hypoxanthine phosphoribosyltransferase
MESRGKAGVATSWDVILPEEAIARRVAEIGARITEDYAGLRPVFVTVLKGGFVFVSDLVRAVRIPHEIDFISAQHTGPWDRPDQDVRILHDLRSGVAGRHVLVVEGIVGTGAVLQFVRSYLELHRPASLHFCTLIRKRAEGQAPIPLRYVGFEIDDEFVVGYGLDYQQLHRQLRFVARFRA